MSDFQPIDLDDLRRVAVKVREKTDDNWLADMVEIACGEITRLRDEQKEVVIPGPSCDDDWLPDYARGHGRGFNDCRRKFIAALTKAGVPVKESP